MRRIGDLLRGRPVAIFGDTGRSTRGRPVCWAIP
jgi:hypothetical protein